MTAKKVERFQLPHLRAVHFLTYGLLEGGMPALPKVVESLFVRIPVVETNLQGRSMLRSPTSSCREGRSHRVNSIKGIVCRAR